MVRERDSLLFADFVTARYGPLYRTAYLLTGNHHTAEDLVQTALTKMYVSWRRVSRLDRPDSYARRAVVNEVVSLHRRRWTREISSERPADLVPARSEQGPEQGVADTNEVRQALGALTPRQRAVVVLRYYEDLSEVEIANILGISPGTVKAHAHAALLALRGSWPDAARASMNEGERA